jgi:hypothetical protein
MVAVVAIDEPQIAPNPAHAATVDIAVVHRLDRGLRRLIVGHLDEAEALASARLTIHHHLRRTHRAVLCEQAFERRVGDLVIQVADVQFLRHALLRFSRYRPGSPMKVSGRKAIGQRGGLPSRDDENSRHRAESVEMRAP